MITSSPTRIEAHTLGLRLLDAIGRRRLPEAPEAVASAPASADTLHVVVVEEDPWVQRLLRRNLQRHGHRVEVLGTPQDVLAWMPGVDHEVNLLVCDVHPPGMDGVRLSEHLHKRFPDMLTLLVSPSNAPPAVVVDQPERFAFLSKPYALDDFEALVDDLVARAHDLAPTLAESSS